MTLTSASPSSGKEAAIQDLALALKKRGDAGEPLPPVFDRLDRIGAKFRRGQMTMIGAAPGGGKSSFALWQTVRLAYSPVEGVPSLYFSADNDQITASMTILAGLINRPMEQCERLIEEGHEKALETLSDATSHIWWNFSSSPTLKDIEDEIEAYAFVHGEYPHHIVVDNLMDVAENGPEMERLPEIILHLNDIARTTGAHVQVLVHVGKGKTGQGSLGFDDGQSPIPRSAILYGISKKPTLILTLYRVEEGVMGIRMVKSRSGSAPADASVGIDVGWLPAQGWFGP